MEELASYISENNNLDYQEVLDNLQETGEHYGLKVYTYNDQEYAVGTDSESENAWAISLNRYENNKRIADMKPAYKNYYADHRWIRDGEDRGEVLAEYDKIEITLDNLFAYRIK